MGLSEHFSQDRRLTIFARIANCKRLESLS
jgi:hypothetical protein